MPHFFHTSTRSVSRMLLMATLFLSLAACNRKVAFNLSTVVPGAEGFVKLKKDKNDNHALDIEVRNLADPKRLASPQNVYVVWAESAEGIKNLGQLKTGSNLLSKVQRAEMETSMPYKPTRIFITAESDASIQYPGAQVVLTTNSF